MMNVSTDIKSQIKNYLSAEEIWNFLERHFEGQGSSRLCKIITQLSELKHQVQTLGDLANILPKLRQKFTLIQRRMTLS